MNSPCANTHPLYNPGTTQAERVKPALLPQNNPFEERTVSDWLVYLSAYAKHINFYDLENELPTQTWESFFKKDVAMLLAQFSEEGAELFYQKITAQIEELQHATLNDAQAKDKLTTLFAELFNMVSRLNSYFLELPANLPFREGFKNKVATRMQHRLAVVLGAYKGARELTLINDALALPADVKPIENLHQWNLVKLWFYSHPATNWDNYYESIGADVRPYEPNIITPTSAAERINLGARHQLLIEAIKGLAESYIVLVQQAREQFEVTITDWPTHRPDRALLIAFLRLLDFYRDELNTFTEKHLEFYYRKVLQVKEKPAVGDQAFVALQLAPNQTEQLVPAGEEFLGGKDADGKALIYQNTRTTVINQAEVVALKSILKKENNVFAGQDAATVEGLEEAPENPADGWAAFGTSVFPEARIGFAIASDHLFLSAGDRSITITFGIVEVLTIEEMSQMAPKISARITGEKGWIETNVSFPNREEGFLRFVLNIPATEPAIVAASEKIHETTLYPKLPVVEIICAADAYDIFSDITLQHMHVAVAANNMSNTKINAAGAQVDASKPFNLFGPLPAAGASAVIDVREAVAKNNPVVTLSAKWQVPDSTFSEISKITGHTWLATERLQNGAWSSVVKTFSGTTTHSINITGLQKQNITDWGEAYSGKSTQGYIRLRLSSNMGHANYANEVAQAIIKADPPKSAVIPKPYYTPAFEYLRLTYTANTGIIGLSQTANPPQTNTHFYHITPFGAYPADGNAQQIDNPCLLMKIANEGALHVGVKNITGGQTLTLLVHVREGSANPLKARQEVSWQMLHNNRWVTPEVWEDGTGGLIRSGIVRVVLPHNFKPQSRYMGDDIFWLRATVAQHVDAVCRVVGVWAQGLKLAISSTEYAPAHFEKPLAAGSISKLKQGNASIKKITQPFDSHNGRPVEKPSAFYTRVSERLRHKNRGISMWDYERLVLENFPTISKVKAQSHTRYYVDELTNDIEYSETAPGHIAIVCVPFGNNNLTAAMRPYTPVNVLDDVKKSLLTIMPEWATLHVRNPQYDEVSVDFNVRFRPEFTDTIFYLKTLEEDLKNYLSPWLQSTTNIEFERSVHKSSIINFLDERPYVDYVRDVKLNVHYADGTHDYAVLEARPKHAVSVLVSAANHKINPI